MTSHEPYQPAARRPIANAFRATAHLPVRACAVAGIHPDVISYLSIVFSALAAFCFWRASRHAWLLIAAPLLCYVRLWMNMLDGMVALATNKASSRGEILNDLPDRISDVLIFAGVAHSGLCAIESGYWAAIFALLTAYVGTLGQAVGGQREFGGMMSKPWRMVALHVGSWATFGLILWNNGEIRQFGLSVLDWTCVIVIIGCVQTIVVRLKRIFFTLANRRGRR